MTKLAVIEQVKLGKDKGQFKASLLANGKIVGQVYPKVQPSKESLIQTLTEVYPDFEVTEGNTEFVLEN